METSGNTGKIVGALLAGALVGATFGILFAPDKGIRTRRRIAEKTEDLTDKIKDEMHTLRNKAEELEEAAEDMIADLKNSLRHATNGSKAHN